MKKYLKRMGAFLLAGIMIIAMGATAFAADASSTAAAAVTKVKVEEGMTVTAYKIALLDQASESGWSAVKDVVIADLTKPTNAELAAIDTVGLEAAVMDQGEADAEGYASFTKDLTPGMYLIKVDGTTMVYNPMAISINLQGDVITGDTIEAKGQNTTVDKTASTPDGKPANDLQVGDQADFTVSSVIPTYGVNYGDTTVTFTLTDTMSADLTYLADSLKVMVGTTPVTVSDIDNVDGQKITVALESQFIKDNAGKTIKMTYSAKLNETAATNFNPNTNDVTLKYTNNPDGSTTEVTDKTYHYTFEIDGGAFGDEKHEDITKTNGKAGNELKKLAGAEFSLYTDAACTDESEFAAATTGSDGQMNFKGLDGNKVYWLKETKAPEGYRLVSTPVKVEVVPAYNGDGKLENYVVKFNDTEATKYVAAYGGTTIITSSGDGYDFANTTTAELPSTGGMGTYLFTILGVLIMAAAVGIFFVNRKKNAR